MQTGDFTALNRAGLNLQAVFDLDQLPAAMAAELCRGCGPAHPYRQLILLGHGGKTLWESVIAAGIDAAHPIDDFSIRTTEQWFGAQFAGKAHEIIYPGNIPVGLQALGKLAGWHHASPFMIGINREWGSWYAYRVVLLADSDLPPSTPVASPSPCESCKDKPCLASCPGGALEGDAFALAKCVGYRKQAASLCRATCIARSRCPVAAEHRYCDEQIAHTYSISMKVIEQHY